MIRLLSPVLLGLFAFCSTAFADEKYASATGKYTAVFPMAPKESKTDADPAKGTYAFFSTSLEINKDSSYLVMYHDYPTGVIKDKPEIVLERVRDGTKGNGRVIEDKEIALGTDKVPGRAFLLNLGDYYFRAHIFLKGDRLYQIIITGKTKEEVTSAAADKFINSFEIVK